LKRYVAATRGINSPRVRRGSADLEGHLARREHAILIDKGIDIAMQTSHLSLSSTPSLCASSIICVRNLSIHSNECSQWGRPVGAVNTTGHGTLSMRKQSQKSRNSPRNRSASRRKNWALTCLRLLAVACQEVLVTAVENPLVARCDPATTLQSALQVLQVLLHTPAFLNSYRLHVAVLVLQVLQDLCMCMCRVALYYTPGLQTRRGRDRPRSHLLPNQRTIHRDTMGISYTV
jgi:hypothetical protein